MSTNHPIRCTVAYSRLRDSRKIESVNMKIKLEKTGERKGGEACHNFFKWLVPVYQLSDWFDRGYINTSQCSLFLSLRKMVWGVQTCEIEESTNFFVQWTYLRDFPHIRALRKEQKTCLVNLVCGKDVLQPCRLTLAKVWHLSCLHVLKDSHYL